MLKGDRFEVVETFHTADRAVVEQGLAGIVDKVSMMVGKSDVIGITLDNGICLAASEAWLASKIRVTSNVAC